jgi:DNA-binding CsgD family transcriptional regulator
MLGADLVRLALARGERGRARDVAAALTEIAEENQEVSSLVGAALCCRAWPKTMPRSCIAPSAPTPADHGRWNSLLPPRKRGQPSRGRATQTGPGRCWSRRLASTSGSKQPATWPRAEAALREAGIGRGRRGTSGRPQTGWDSLTPTEHTVADLVAKGLSNPQIGERLYILRRTVQAHLAHVLPSWTSLPARSLLPRSPSGSGRRHSGRRAGSAVCAGPPWPDRLVSAVRLAAFAKPGTDGCRPVRLARSRRRRARQPRVLTIYMQPAWGSAFTRAGT